MKQIRLFIAMVSVLALTACGGGEKEDDPIIQGKTFNQNVTLDAKGTQQTVRLTDLKSKIDDVTNGNAWLTVLINTYTSDSPSIVVMAEENTSTNQRNGSITITAKSGDKVILAVTQEGVGEQKTGIDDSHDVPTDQPAYSRQR